MKALFAVSILAIALGSLGTSFAAQSESAMLDCFNKHAQLMDKPALKNPRDCWRVHGYLSERS